MTSPNAMASGLDDRAAGDIRRRPTNTASRDYAITVVDHDAETDSSDPKKNKPKEKIGLRAQTSNIIAVVSLLLNLAVAIPFGYLSFWGSKTAEEDASKASTVAAKLARWQNCIDHADHPVCTPPSEGQDVNPVDFLL